MRIGTDKSAAAKQYTAEIACNDHAHIGKPTLLQHIENRHTSRSLRLAVVGISGNIVLTEDVSVDIVLSLAVLCLYGIDELDCFVICFNRGDIADELRTFFNEGGFGRFRNCEIIHNFS